MKLTTEELQTGQLSAERAAEALRTFRDTGLLTLEDVYSDDFIQTLRAAYERELEKHLASLGGMEALEGKTFGKNHIGFFPPMFAPIAEEQIAAHPIAVQLMHSLLGKEFQCSFYHTNTAYPGSGVQPIHRDTGSLFGPELSVPHPVVSLVINIPLCDFTEENGSTEVWPGTHLIVDDQVEPSRSLEARAAHLPSIRLNCSVGSLVLRDLRCWHRGMPNNADYARTMMAIVYQRGWISEKLVTIPRSTWDSWSEVTRHIFRKNTVVPDAEYHPRTW